MCSIFERLDEKHIGGKFRENFEIFWYKFLRKIEFFIFLFFYFYFLFFFENLLLKIELSEITPFFYNNFFSVSGGGDFPLSPLTTPLCPIVQFILAFNYSTIINVSIARVISGLWSILDRGNTWAPTGYHARPQQGFKGAKAPEW